MSSGKSYVRPLTSSTFRCVVIMMMKNCGMLPTALMRRLGAMGKSENALVREDVLIVEAPSILILASSKLSNIGRTLPYFRLLYSVYEVALFCWAMGILGHPHTCPCPYIMLHHCIF